MQLCLAVSQNSGIPLDRVWSEMDCFEVYRIAEAIMRQVEQMRANAPR